MKFPLRKISATLLLGLGAWAAAEDVAPQEGADSTGQELLGVTNDMWFLLSGVTDKEDADAAAPRFLELATKASGIGDRFFSDDGDGQDLEAISRLPYQSISEAYEDLTQEFEVLCQTQCYGSDALMTSFRKAVELGLFSEDSLEDFDSPASPLSESEIRHEQVRYKRLVEPDRAVLQILSSVNDAGSANKAVQDLLRLTERLRQLLPEGAVGGRRFADADRQCLKDAYAPIEPLLWGIRNEIVRIAGIPGYDDEPFDAFSDALDDVFENLGDTHNAWFNEVFDASFRTDLDNALRENLKTNVTSSN